MWNISEDITICKWLKIQNMDAHNNANRCYKFLQNMPKNGLQQMLLNSLRITIFEQNKIPMYLDQRCLKPPPPPQLSLFSTKFRADGETSEQDNDCIC